MCLTLTLLVLPGLQLQPTLRTRAFPRCSAGADPADAAVAEAAAAVAEAAAAVAEHSVLGPLCEATEAACVRSTGQGMESSGSGRPEWGTWCDTELFAEAKSCLNRVALHTAEGDAIPH